MKVKKFIKFFLITLVLIIIGLLSYLSFFKKQNYFVLVEDEKIFQELKEYSKEIDLPFSFYQEIPENKSTNFFSKIFEKENVIVGNVSVVKDFAFNPFEKTENQEVFKIGQRKFIPSVEMDFTSFKSEDYVKLPPDFSISVNPIENLPENHRGVKVENQYATENGYLFTENTYLVCNFFKEDFKQPILDFFDQFFKGEKSNITLVEENAGEKPVFIAGVGDMMVGRGVQELLIYYKDGLSRVFADTLPILQNSDFTLGNLEGAVTYFDEILPKTYNFKFDKKVLTPLKSAGFDYLMINNNHVFDYGLQGFLDSLGALEEAGIATSGVGKNLAEASKFFITEIRGQKIAIISVGNYPKERSGFDGANVAATEEKAGVLWKNEKIYEDIKKLKNQGMLIIASVHDGNEYGFVTSKSQRVFAEKLIDAGASLVLESHTHILQPIEWYKGGIIAYGLGNFIFPGMEEIYGATESLVLRVGFVEGKPIYVEPFPCIIEGTQVRLK